MALHGAVTSGNQANVLKLITRGAEINALNPYKQTPLYIACQHTNETLVGLLLNHGADATVPSSDGSGPIHVAAKIGNVPILQLLIEHRANLSARDNDGRTPLFWAVAGGQRDAAEVLIKAGASLEQIDDDGLAPLHLAARGGETAIVELLVRSGAHPNLAARNGYRPIHYATMGKHLETVKKLRALGADLNMPTDGGIFPRKLAMELEYSDIADWLEQAGGEFSLDVSFPSPYGSIYLSTDTQEYLSVVQVKQTGADKFVVLVCEPHGNSEAQWMMYCGLRGLFIDNPQFVTNSVFLCEGTPAGVPISIEPLRKVEPAPDDDLLKQVLDSFLLPAYLGFQWVSNFEIPTFGAEDDALYQIAVRFAAYGASASAGNLSLVSRNPSMAEAACGQAKAGKMPFLFLGLGHIHKIPQESFEDSRVGLSFWRQRFQVGPREQALLWGATNCGVGDLLVQRHVDYLVIQAYGQDKPVSISDALRYQRLFQAQLSGSYEDYIKQCLLEQGNITVQPSPAAAAQLASALKAAKADNKEKTGKGDNGNKNGKKNADRKSTKKPLPARDSTGKVHGELPRPNDLDKYSREELETLRDDLKQSVQERIKKSVELGRDKAHGARQAAEQDLIKSIDKYLGDLGGNR